MRVMLLTETLTAGGAEIFCLRLARHLKMIGIPVVVFNCRKDLVNQILLDKYQDCEIVHLDSKIDWLYLKIDRFLNKIQCDWSLRQLIVKSQISRLISERGIDVVHSHLFPVDYSFARIRRLLKVKHIITNHGDYQLFLNREHTNQLMNIIGFRKKAAFVFDTVDSIVCITRLQQEFLRHEFGMVAFNKSQLIYNGFTPDQFRKRNRSELGIPENHFVFGMIARGIREKGWEFAVSAFLKLSHLPVSMVLVGEGPFLKNFLHDCVDHKNIHAVGFSENPLEWISIVDVCLLPSYYHAESQPNIVLESLSVGKPIICSDIGDVKDILEIGNVRQCGFVVSVSTADPRIDIDELHHKMKMYMDDPQLLNQHKSNAKERFKDFQMERCAAAYLSEYQKNVQ